MRTDVEQTRQQPFRVPLATYRLQFNQQFNFADAMAIVDYLDDLGVTDCYASPIFPAGPQSTHGYDICRFDSLNSVLGTTEQFGGFASALQARNMGLLLDMVPNHMGCDCSNTWWWDVLANGPTSTYARYFDIDWAPAHLHLRDKVLLPILEDHYSRVLEAGKLRLAFRGGAFQIVYYDNAFPVSEASTLQLLQESEALPELPKTSGLAELTSLLHRHAKTSAEFSARIDGLVKSYNKPGSFDRLHSLLQAQHYRLTWWKTGLEENNYRRFFDIMGLVSVRMELPEVFEAAHEFIFELIARGQVTGLRIDHPDGLWAPKAYFTQLQDGYQKRNRNLENSGSLFVVAEKILTGDEQLPGDWPVHGTTGYDFLNRLNGLFVAGENKELLDRTYREFTGVCDDFQSIVYAAKEQVLMTSFKSELTGLAHRLRQLASQTRTGQDITLESLRTALATVVVTFPVYRTYVDEETKGLPETQGCYVRHALDEASKLKPDTDSAAYEFIGSLLLLDPPPELDSDAQAQARILVMKFQQLTGPVMAKGLEDTAFYRFNRLVSLNEVGGEPGHFGTTVDEFHAFNARQAQRWPHTLLAAATHDTKRGEDMRARINVLSEMADTWRNAVTQWRELNQPIKSRIGNQPAPDANDEYLLYQTILGAWPFNLGEWKQFRERVRDYMLKVIREAKQLTNWLQPNTAYEKGVASFVEAMLQENSAFVNAAKEFQQRVAYFARFNSLSQTAIKLTAPGTPDIYQGTELWDFSLVDPDNRRPVDYGLRRKVLKEVRTLPVSVLRELLKDDQDGKLKMYVLQKLLHLRRAHREVFERGSYVPLAAPGRCQPHVFAYARVSGETRIIVVATRLLYTLLGGNPAAPLGDAWKDTTVKIPGSGRFTNALTGETLAVATDGVLELREALAVLPLAVLYSS